MPADLLSALAAQGAYYTPAVSRVEIAFPPTPGLIPPSTFLCVQVVDEEIILARTDLSAGDFSVSNPQKGAFTHIVSFNTPIGNVPIPRGWTSVDATIPSGTVRFINTHLESFDGSIRNLWAASFAPDPPTRFYMLSSPTRQQSDLATRSSHRSNPYECCDPVTTSQIVRCDS